MHTVVSKIWTWVTEFIAYDDKHVTYASRRDYKYDKNIIK